MQESSSFIPISTKLERIAMLARGAPSMAFTTLAHYIDILWLREAFRLTRKDGAPGVDRQSATEYAANLESNLERLLDRVKSGTYRAPPVRRVYIPKGNGTETRPLGIPTFEDKLLQRAVVMVLGAVYEQDFLDCSYGFRPGRSAHQALDAIWTQATRYAGAWIIEIDIRKYFETIDHERLRGILRQRVRDKALLRLIGKWLKAGVLDGETLSYPQRGSPQGGVVSPLLANIYLHEVLDVWFQKSVLPRMRGKAQLVRYADDAVLIFERKYDAERVMAVLPKRFERFGLALHPEKTRMVGFGRPDVQGGKRPATFDFLGFTHYWGRSPKAKWIVYRKTAKDRFRRALSQVYEWCRASRHLHLRVQQRALSKKLLGHYEYFGILGNTRALRRFRYEVVRAWRKWLSRRSQRAYVTWERMTRLLERYTLPQARLPRRVLRAAKP